MKEEWKTIKGFERYEVSNLGRVKRKATDTTGMSASAAKKAAKEKILKPQKHKQGYQLITLYKETPRGVPNEKKIYTVHALVAEAFLGERPDGLVINHKDNNHSNNKVDNLEYCTHDYNMKQSVIQTGYDCFSRKKVAQYDMEGNLIKTYESITSTKKDGFTSTEVSKCCNNKLKKYKGFIWKFVEEN